MSKDYFISDVHIKDPLGEEAELFIKFLEVCQENAADRVFLLGDIFDLLVGPYPEYEKKYKRVFDRLEDLIAGKCKVFYFEGNHDFHLKKFFIELQLNRNLPFPIYYVKNELVISLATGKVAHISHGDEMEIENVSYKIYKRFVNNRFVELLSEQCLNYNFVDWLGQKTSANSKNRNQLRYNNPENQEFIRSKFRRSAKKLSQKIDVDMIIAGHSHCKDDYVTDNGTRYLNNGYAPIAKSCLYSDESGVRFIDL